MTLWISVAEALMFLGCIVADVFLVTSLPYDDDISLCDF